MKKIVLYIIATIILLATAGCGSTEQPSNDNPSPIEPNNSAVDIDTSSVVRTPQQGLISVSTDSIKEVLTGTGRFEIAEVPQLSGVDVFCGLDKENGNSIANVNFTALDNATAMISYNFSKEAVQGQTESSVRWGLNALFQILGDKLTDEIWNDILSVAARTESVGDFGTDFDGYSNPDTGIKLTYADLGSNVQIDIEPYNG